MHCATNIMLGKLKLHLTKGWKVTEKKSRHEIKFRYIDTLKIRETTIAASMLNFLIIDKIMNTKCKARIH